MSEDIFDRRKKDILSKLDKSSIGKWDTKIISICNKINKSKNYYTTSSCSGRVTMNVDKEKKGPGVFLRVGHELINFRDFKKDLDDLNGDIKFKQEPVILHVACKTLKDAQNLVDKAKFAGFKRSGLIATEKRFVAELISTEKLEFPIIHDGEILVDDNFLKIVVKKSNENLKKGWMKIENLYKLL